MADEKDKQPEGFVKESQNPGGTGFPDDPNQLREERGRNVQPDEADRAAERALSDHPVTNDEIRDQSAYDGAELDVGQQAGDAEKEQDRRDPSPERPYPPTKP
jgi:hypothetical protein